MLLIRFKIFETNYNYYVCNLHLIMNILNFNYFSVIVNDFNKEYYIVENRLEEINFSFRI